MSVIRWYKLLHRYKVLFIGLLLCVLQGYSLHAQEATSVQIKTFDQNLSPISNLSISINGKEYIPIEKKGVVFHDVLKADLPPKSIKVNRDELEAESWNYSKGTLEIIIRKKAYQIVDVRVKNTDNKSLVNLTLQYNGTKTTTATTNGQGVFQLPLALTEELTPEKFVIPGFQVTKIVQEEKEKVIVIESLAPPKPKETPKVTETADQTPEFNVEQLKTITTLSVFYAVFKNYDISKFDEATRKLIDEKFFQLAQEENNKGTQFIEKISDSSVVSTDVKNLLAQATLENQLLENFRRDFNKKILLINNKLSRGAANLDDSERKLLLNDINALEDILNKNESKFYQNISDYRLILTTLRTSFSDIQDLENKLDQMEIERQKEQEEFRQKIIVAGSIVTVFGILLVILVYFRIRLKKQQKNLIEANDQITRMNETLEELVSERTRQLLDAYREMDIFLYRASHDLRSPISSIVGLCNLAPYSDPSELLELTKKISGTALRMDTMLNKLGIISEINHPANYSSISFSQKMELVKIKFAKFIQDNNVSIVTTYPEDLSFSSYPNLIEIILHNLVENALFFCTVEHHPNPKVTVNAKIENNFLIVSIHDNGIGITDEIRTKLWEMFFVGHEYSKGNGLGLYIVYKALHALNGTIDVQSENHKYSVFTVTIPINTDHLNTLTSVTSPPRLLKKPI